MTDLTLRVLTEDDAPELQRLYEGSPDALSRLMGGPATAGQAAGDLAVVRDTSGRFEFGAYLDGRLVGLLDCKVARDVPGQAAIGLLLVADDEASPELAALILRIVTRWLMSNYAVSRLETGVPAQDPAQIMFWQAQGFVLTGQQYRRDFNHYHPRFLVLARDLVAPREEAQPAK